MPNKPIIHSALSHGNWLRVLCFLLLLMVVNPVLRAQGGTTIQNYFFSTGVNASKWITLTAPQTITNTHVDDQAYGSFNIGFSFYFCGADYSQFSVNSNGCFKLGSTACNSSYSSPLTSSTAGTNAPKIIGIGRDLSIGSGGHIRYETVGTAPNRILVCEYKLSHTSSNNTAGVMWQVQLYENNGEVLIVYNSTPSNTPSSFQIGIANDGNDVVTVNPSNHTVSYGSTSSTYSAWPGQWRYYSFLPPSIDCGLLTRASVSAVGTNSAFVQWSIRNASPSAQVVLQYDNDPEFNSPQSVTVTGNPPYALTGLEAGTTYYLRLSINCTEGTSEALQTIQFTTLPQLCTQYATTPDTIAFDYGTNTDNYLWGYSYYKYSITEQIYRQQEMGASATLYGMAVQTGNTNHPRNISIYLGHTSETSVDGWLLPDDLTLVWTGFTQYATQSWNDIQFLTPFVYNGLDNLLLVIVDQTGTYQSSPYNTVYVHSNSGYNSRYLYSDGTSYSVNVAPTSNGTASSYRANVRWYSYECISHDECELPSILVNNITDHSAEVQWSPTNTANYRIYVGTADETPTLVATTSGTTYTLTDLESDTRYTIYVLPDCATSLPLWGGNAEFRTDCGEMAGGCIAYDDLTSCRVECRHGNFDNPDATLGVYDFGPASSSSCHTVHSNPAETDSRTGSQLYTVPDGYATSVRLGNWETGYGAESIRYRYKVDTTESDLLILKYAAVLQDPNHTAIEQPRFTFRVTDENGVDLDAACYSADFIANSNLGWNSHGSVLWKDWTTVGVSLTPFHGQTIYIKLTTYDCNQGGHYGYAYFVIDCGNKQLTSSSCGNTEENTYTAPAGFNYRWYNDNAPDDTLSTEQSYHVTAAGTYHCQLSFVGASNASCSSVLTAISGSRYPFSRFNYTFVDTVDCSVEIRFYNNSVITRDFEHNQLTNYPCESYLWIFDDGTTSTDINPYHTLSEGTHEVKLVAMLSNGTCSDTSTVTIHIDGLCEPIIGYDNRTICEHELPYEWNGVQFLSEGTQEAVLQTASHADSTVVMTLTVLQPTNTAVNDTACETFTWNGTAYTLSGSYTHSHPDANHCIQVDTLHLTINYNTSGVDTRTVCDSLRWHDSLYTASTTTPTHHSTNAAGCDSTTTLHLTINNHLYAVDEHNVCDSLRWHGTIYYASTDSPTYNSVSAAGCDSTTTLHLTIRYSTSGDTTASVCDSFTWYLTGETYTQDTILNSQFSILNSEGCDSVTTLHLTVRYSTSGIDEQDVCDSHTWHGTTYTASTLTPTHLSTNAAGCDSVTTLHLTVRHSTHGVDTRTVCDSLRWHDSLYLVSTNTPTHLSTNAAGCDSTTTLHLTVNNHIYAVDAHNVCDSLRWNGTTYHASTDSPTHNSVSAAGCDSTTTLHLTVRYSSNGIDEQHVCDALTWHGTTYTESTNTPVYHSINAAGCDSTTTLHLTVLSSTQTTETLSACDSMTWHGTTYRSSTSTATYHSTNEAGCDSTVTLHLTIYTSYDIHHNDTICEGGSIRFAGEDYSERGDYTIHLQSSHSCDSTVTMHLTVRQKPQVEIVAEYGCPTETWKLLAITDGERYTWSTAPRNQQLASHEHDTIIRLHVDDSTLLTLTADYATGVSCPSFDQVTLSPIVKVTAQIECRPEVLREDHPEILAIDKSHGSNNRDWYVDDLAWGNTPTISYTIDKSTNELTFTLIAYNDHCADTAKRTLYSTNESLFTPNVFTPSLSTNSTFRIQGTGILEFHITIYTREGQLVFSSNDIDSEWDGTHNGEPCPQANYVYHIRYRGRSMPDGWQTATGSVLLLR